MSRSLTKNNRVLALIAVMAAASFAVGGLVFGVSTADSTSLKNATSALRDLNAEASGLATAILVQEAALAEFALTGSPIALKRFEAAVQHEIGIVANVAATGELPLVRSAFALIATASMEWRRDVAAPGMSAVLDKDASELAGSAA